MRRIPIAALLVALALSLAACGSDKQPAAEIQTTRIADASPEEILRAAQNAFRAAESVRIRGKVTGGGESKELDLRIARGVGARGHLVYEGMKINLIRLDNQVWLQGREFWTRALEGDGGSEAARKAAEEYGDKWIPVPAEVTGSDNELLGYTDLDGILEEMLMPKGDFTKGGTREIRGVPAIALNQEGGMGTLWVATEGEPYPVRITPDEGSGEKPDQFVDFFEYNEPVDIKAPKNVLEDASELFQ